MSIPKHDPKGGIVGSVAAHTPFLFSIPAIAAGKIKDGEPVSIFTHEQVKKANTENIVGFAMNTAKGETENLESLQVLTSGILWGEAGERVSRDKQVRINFSTGKFVTTPVGGSTSLIQGALFLTESGSLEPVQVLIPPGFVCKKD